MLLATGDLVKCFGCCRNQIETWEKEGLIPRAGRTPKGHRRWPAEQIAAVLQKQGLPVPESWGIASTVAA